MEAGKLIGGKGCRGLGISLPTCGHCPEESKLALQGLASQVHTVFLPLAPPPSWPIPGTQSNAASTRSTSYPAYLLQGAPWRPLGLICGPSRERSGQRLGRARSHGGAWGPQDDIGRVASFPVHDLSRPLPLPSPGGQRPSSSCSSGKGGSLTLALSGWPCWGIPGAVWQPACQVVQSWICRSDLWPQLQVPCLLQVSTGLPSPSHPTLCPRPHPTLFFPQDTEQARFYNKV